MTNRRKPLLPPILLLLASPLAGCGTQGPATPSTSRETVIEQRVADLERRVLQLETRSEAVAPNRNLDEIRQNIAHLEAERAKLMLSYTELHPAIRDIDRQLTLLRAQLQTRDR